MSRWLSSVNNLLEKLDDRAETGADDIETTARTAAALAGRFLGGVNRPGASSDDEEEEYEDSYLDSGEEEEEYYEDEEEEYEDEEEGEEYDEAVDEGQAMNEEGDDNFVDDLREEEVTLNLEADPDASEHSTPLFDDDRVSETDVIVDKKATATTTEESPLPPPPVSVPSDPPPAQEEEETAETLPNTEMEMDPPSIPVVEESSQQDTDATASPVTPPPQPTNVEAEAETEMEKKVIAIAPTPSVPEKPKPVPPPPPPRLSPPPTATVSVVEKVVSKQTPPQSPLPPSPSPPSSAGASNTAALQQQQQLLKKYKSESKKSTQDVQRLSKLTATLEAQLEAAQAEMKKYKSESKKSIQDGQRLTKLTATLEAQLEAAQAEMQAQQDELQRAAETMQQERLRNQEEHEDLLDDHDDQVEKLTAEHEARFEKQENMYQEQLANLQGRVQQQEEKRMQEGGDWTKELEDALARERDALKRLDEVQTGKNALESGKVKLEMQQEALQSRVGSLSAASETAVEREREAEEKLDEAMSAHKRQLNQRQTREAELERTVAELGAALTLAQQQRDSSSGRNARALVGEQTAEISYKDKYEVSAEELETVKTQLSLATQRSEALQQELQDVSNERIAETAAVQERQHEHDGKVATLTTQVSRLDASLREIKQNDDGGGTSTSKTSESAGDDNDRVHQLMREVDKSKRQIASLSDQLIRQQGSAEATKSEILALKGRLQAASARAEAAEQTDEKAYEMEGGGVTYTASKQLRRRVKSGRGKSNQLQTRSVRSALGMRLNEGSGMEQIALTIDALDAWMLDTGSIMRHEPLARVGFALYLALLHLWCFVLVFFHAVASEHGDLGSLTVPRAPGPLHVP